MAFKMPQMRSKVVNSVMDKAGWLAVLNQYDCPPHFIAQSPWIAAGINIFISL